jgi:tetratricopeptide (TPR) repeat protein
LSEAAVAEVAAWRPDRILLLPLYPHYSAATTGSSLEAWRQAARAARLDIPTRAVCCYPLERGFVQAHAALIREAWPEAAAAGRPRLLFSAHGLPETFIKKGDPYQWQIEQTCAAVAEALEIGGEAVALADQHDFPYWRATGRVWGGWALVQRQEIEKGLAQIQESLAQFRANGNVQTIPHALSVLAEVYGQAGESQKGLEALAEALAVLERTNERRREAEIHRLRGTLLLALRGPHRGDAEASFARALAVAREQSARMWELRAAVSLARLRVEQGKGAEACNLLASLYDWFTEGFDTADLKDAKALLDELR